MINYNADIKLYKDPFTHWEVSNLLADNAIGYLLNASKSITPGTCMLKRTENAARLFIRDGGIADSFSSISTKVFFSSILGIDLCSTRTRIELCVDAPGFSLEPHIDIEEKLLTLQIYLEGESHCGTNLYPSKTVVLQRNLGWLIKNNNNSLHGFDRRSFTKNRVSLIVNYVTDDWWDVEQLVKVERSANAIL